MGFFFVLALAGERCSSVLGLASIDESESESESGTVDPKSASRQK